MQSSFGIAPKALDAVDVACSDGKLIAAMIDSKVFGITNIDQPIVTTPSVAVDHHFGSHATPYDRLQTNFGTIRHNLGINTAIAFQKTKNRGLARGAALNLF